MRKYEQSCPIARTLDVIGDRWTLLIVRDLMMGRTKFRDLRDSGGMPPKVLSARLKMLMDEGIVERSVYSEHPLRAEYGLTEKGRALTPVLMEIGRWGFENQYDGEARLREKMAEIIYEHLPASRKVLREIGYVKGHAGAD